MIRRLAAAAVVAVACVVVIGVQPAGALPCGDAHDATSTEATLNTDGSMDVVETLSFDFDDGCHGGETSSIPRPGSRLSSASAAAPR